MIDYYYPDPKHKDNRGEKFVFKERAKVLGEKKAAHYCYYYPHPGEEIKVWKLKVEKYRCCS